MSRYTILCKYSVPIFIGTHCHILRPHVHGIDKAIKMVVALWLDTHPFHFLPLRWRLVGPSAAPAARKPCRTMTLTSTSATSASTSLSRCTATCPYSTRSSAWTLCSSRRAYPTTRLSASSSSSPGLGPAKNVGQNEAREWGTQAGRKREQRGLVVRKREVLGWGLKPRNRSRMNDTDHTFTGTCDRLEAEKNLCQSRSLFIF